MKLTRLVTGSLQELLSQSVTGDVILICEGKSFIDWAPHPEGVVVWRDVYFLLNDDALLYKGVCTGWAPHPEGVAIHWADELLLNGEKDKPLLGETLENLREKIDVRLHGKITQQGDALFLNGVVLYKGVFDRWQTGPQGVFIQQGNMLSLVVCK